MKTKRNLIQVCLLCAALLQTLNAGAQAIIQIASGDNVSYYVKSDGSLWRGDRAHAMAKQNERMQSLMNELKQHPQSAQAFEKFREEGKRITSGNFEPVDLIVSNGVTAATARSETVFFIKEGGSLWAMGNNNAGQLGDGTFDTPDQPIQIVPGGVTAVAAGEAATIFLKADGSLWGFGWNHCGELGDGAENNTVTRPEQIVASNVVAIAAGYGHSLFIKSDGSLWGMGNNGYGQLGLGTNIERSLLPVEIVASNVVSVAAAHYQSLCIKSDGSLWGMGLNNFGQIGDCTIDWPYIPKQVVSNDVVAVIAGDMGTMFLKHDGSLWAMGINWLTDYGEGIEFNSQCPEQIVAPNKAAIVAGYYYNARLKTCASIGAGKFRSSTEASAANNKDGLRPSVASLPGYNLIAVEPLKNGDVRLTYFGNADVNYALERSSSLANPNWVSLVTNRTASGGVLVVTNTPDTTMNNFWRIRSVP
jgi:hypothetical protein